MNNKRESGILCHISSLPGSYGIGDFGQEAYDFADMLAETGQSLWQILPLSPVGFSASPYQGLSAFAGNKYLISPRRLYEEGLLSESELASCPEADPEHIDFPSLTQWKDHILESAAERFADKGLSNDYYDFEKNNSSWLEDYAFFTAMKTESGTSWTQWSLTPAEKANMESRLERQIRNIRLIQFFFFSQWKQLKEYANSKHIKIIGDLPIFLDFEAESLWAHPELFCLDKDNKPTCVSGVPPDYFCPDGQYWGNPMYNWQAMKTDNYAWWKQRLELLFETVDIVRIDHFRAFSEAWRIIPNEKRNACTGSWEKGPGKEFFDSLALDTSKGSIIAEDLGIIDDKVRKLRDECNFPGMCILQFAFDGSDSLYLPHNHRHNQVVYTGTHDNNTTIGWWNEQTEEQRDLVRRYLSIDGMCINQQLMRAAAMSTAETAIYTIQDLLGLDSRARMNVPGVASGNWSWRFRSEQLTEHAKAFLSEITGLYKRYNTAE